MRFECCQFVPPVRRRPSALWRLFRGEDGGMLVLSMFVFVIMLLAGGIAVDVMRHESERVRLQSTSDRAVIAAAVMRENPAGVTPRQLVDRYFQAEGYDLSVLSSVTVADEGTRGRRVEVAVRDEVPNLFMRMVGQNAYDVRAPAEARTTTAAGRTGAPLDLVLVLDVSGSMNSNNKIGNLRRASADLAEFLLRDTVPGHVSITIVPYADWVIPPTGFLNHFTNIPQTTQPCADFTIWNDFSNSPGQPMTRHSCTVAVSRTARVFMHDADETVARLRALTTQQGTSIDLGVRFGAMFFDPSMRPVIQTMIDNDQIHENFAGRPFGPTDRGVVRAMVLMTDGKNNPNGTRSGTTALFDTRTLAACNELRRQNVTVYAVAFEAPSEGIDLLRKCATSENHFFNTAGVGIVDVFRGIGNSIQVQVETLRLTK